MRVIGIIFFCFLLCYCRSKSGHRLETKKLGHKKSVIPRVQSIPDGRLDGKVIGIIDGDTYDLLLSDNSNIRIRMEGIDAPEKGMPFYIVAKNYLATLCFGKLVSIIGSGKDSHDRILAFSYLEDGTELSHEMLKAGLAWHFKKYNSDSDLAQLENEARLSKIGIWSLNHPMSPWDNRARHRNGISTKDSFGISAEQR